MALTFALAGNPNSGKTTLFNELTGSTAHVGNWPGVTVDRKEGQYKHEGKLHNIIDLPGIYSLSPYTQEEVIARNYLIDHTPDVIINIVDATNLERNLYLTTQLMETDVPIVVALNMIDLVERNGDRIDVPALQQALGLPVVTVSALKARGVHQLIHACEAAAAQPRQGASVLSQTALGHELDVIVAEARAAHLRHAVFHGVKLLENDPLPGAAVLTEAAKERVAQLRVEAQRVGNVEDFEAWVADQRYQYITANYSPNLTRKDQRVGALTMSDKVDRVLTNRILGIPIFLGFMFLVFHLTFGETLLGIPDLPSPGVWLQGLTEELIGWLGGGIAAGLTALGASDWAMGLVVDGIVGGVGAMLSFVPQIMLLFLFLSILEDSGYMARAAFLMDRLLRRFGLSGRSFLPMLMGFGCSVPALMAARTLPNERDRRLTMILVPFMSCGAKMPIYAVFTAALFASNSDLVVFSIYIAGIVVAILSGILLKKLVMKNEASPFIMELPSYHLPQLKSLALHLWDKLKGFMVRAGTVILGATVVVWFLSNFNFSLQMVEANSQDSMLGIIGNGLRYIFVPLGFASGPEGWKAAVAILTGFIAKEAIVSTLGVLYGAGDAVADDGAAAALSTTLVATFSPLAAISFLLFNLLNIPCMAAVSALRSEMSSAKWTWFAIGYWFTVAWVVSFAVFQVGRLLGY